MSRSTYLSFWYLHYLWGAGPWSVKPRCEQPHRKASVPWWSPNSCWAFREHIPELSTAPCSSHPGAHGGIGLPFQMQAGSSKEALKDKLGGNDLSSTLGVTAPNKPEAHSVTLVSVRSVPVARSTKLTAGPCMGQREEKVQQHPKAQPDCAVKARAVHQKCHIKREFEHFRACKETLGCYRRLNLTISFPTVRHWERSCKGTSYKQTINFVDLHRKEAPMSFSDLSSTANHQLQRTTELQKQETMTPSLSWKSFETPPLRGRLK